MQMFLFGESKAKELNTCLRNDQVDEFQQHLNSINPNIQFILELEDTKVKGLPLFRHYHHQEGYAA